MSLQDRTSPAQRLGAAFAARHGAPPELERSAPGRVNLIGEHLDYNEGLCLPFALDRRTFVAARRREDDRLRLASLQADEDFAASLADVGPGTVPGWAGYAAGTVWALREAGIPVAGMDLLVDGTVPLGSGLSSSAALEAAVALAVAALAGLPDEPDLRGRLAEACMRAENEVVGAATGGMDQLAAMFCTPGHALLIDFLDLAERRADATEQIPFDPGPRGLTVLVIDTRAPHRLADGQYARRRETCAAAARLLGVESLRRLPDGVDPAMVLRDPEQLARVRHVRSELARVEQVVDLLRAGRVDEIGPVLTASHLSLRDDYEVSSPELDAAVVAALDAGALGARMVGGGFGGSAIALVPIPKVDAVTDAVRTRFADAGFAEPAFLTAEPSAGAS